MKDYTEFNYHKHFFESERLLNSLIIKIFPEFSWKYYKYNDSTFLNNEFLDISTSGFTEIDEEEYNLERSYKYQTLNYELQHEIIQTKDFLLTMDSYMEYLFVEFKHAIHVLYKETKSRNKDYIFKNLLKVIEESNDYYSKVLDNFKISKLQRIIIQKLIEENQRKLDLIKNDFRDLVSNVNDYFTKKISSETITLKAEQQQNFHNIFISKEQENWFLHALEHLNWLTKSTERGFQAKILAFYDLDECKKNIFKRTVYKKDFVDFLNNLYQREVIKPANNYSKSDNAQDDLKKHIALFPIPT